MLFAQVEDVVFSLTRSATVTAALGNLRNLMDDMSQKAKVKDRRYIFF